MFTIGSYRAMAIVLALAALAFTASGVPDNKGTDAAIGWFAFLALTLTFLALAVAAVMRRRRPSAHDTDAAGLQSSPRSRKVT
jgi:hypothetical protein